MLRGESVKITYHRDGTITYWSVYNQIWEPRQNTIPDKELAAMNDKERVRVKKHLDKFVPERD
jgi:hypothetical protein